MIPKDKTKRKVSSELREYYSPSHGIFFHVKKHLYRRDSPYQRIEVIDNKYFGKVLLLDGLVQVTERDEFFYHEMLVHPACIAHPSPRNLLIIGGGDGGALKEILRYSIEQAFLVEIDNQVIDVSKKFFPWLSSSLMDKRVKLVIANGVEFIEKTDKKFDIIFIDSSDPVGPSVSLHERDFFKKIKSRLAPRGILVSQVGSPFYHLTSIKEKRIFLQKLFQIIRFYVSPVPSYPGGNWCFVFLSDEIKPLNVRRDPPPGLRYFNKDIHRAAFALPNYLRYDF